MSITETTVALNDAQAKSLATTKAYFKALEDKDIAAVAAVLADDMVYVVALTPSGDPAPWTTCQGKAETVDYAKQAMTLFERIGFVNPVFTVSADATVVFMETHGDYIGAKGAKPYRNVYVFKVTLQDGLIVHITEYTNPVTYSQLAGSPLG